MTRWCKGAGTAQPIIPTAYHLKLSPPTIYYLTNHKLPNQKTHTTQQIDFRDVISHRNRENPILTDGFRVIRIQGISSHRYSVAAGAARGGHA